MSRIGKKPVPVPASVTATITGQTVKFKGPKGELEFTLPEKVRPENGSDGVEVKPVDDS
jgi:large subunit ribosomal protein L6